MTLKELDAIEGIKTTFLLDSDIISRLVEKLGKVTGQKSSEIIAETLSESMDWYYQADREEIEEKTERIFHKKLTSGISAIAAKEAKLATARKAKGKVVKLRTWSK